MVSLNRVVMQRVSRSWIRALNPGMVDAVELSGAWGRGLPFRSYQSLPYSVYDPCKGPFLADDGQPVQVDMILANQVWEHVKRPYAATRNVHRMLRPGGWFWLATPFYLPYHAAPVDCSRWSAQGLANLLAEAGFDESSIRAEQWGNRAAALRNLELPWPPRHQPEDDLTNDPAFPIMAWAMARKA